MASKYPGTTIVYAHDGRAVHAASGIVEKLVESGYSKTAPKPADDKAGETTPGK